MCCYYGPSAHDIASEIDRKERQREEEREREHWFLHVATKEEQEDFCKAEHQQWRQNLRDKAREQALKMFFVMMGVAILWGLVVLLNTDEDSMMAGWWFLYLMSSFLLPLARWIAFLHWWKKNLPID